MTTFADPTAVDDTAPTMDPASMILADHLRELIWTGARSSERSLQTQIGMSEVGTDCDREIAYKLAEVPPTNLGGDPLPAIIGTGFHLHMEKMFGALDPRRYLIETPVFYGGIRGTVDLFDRRRHLLVDWKSTSKRKVGEVRRNGPTQRQKVQVQLYGAAMAAKGEQVDRIALAFVPRDGSLDDLYVWSAVPDPQVAAEAIDRVDAIANAVATESHLEKVPAFPSRLCAYCDHYLPGSTDIARGCPGPTPK